MKILFIGNSYTYYNDLPAIFAALAEENGRAVTVNSVTCGGRRLWEYTEREDEYAAQIREKATDHWDGVFLQEHSLGPLLDYPLFAHGVKQLVNLLDSEGFILYQTWGRKAGSPTLAEHGWTNKSMTEGLAKAYQRLGRELGIPVSPVGTAFYALGKSHPAIDLYDPDLTHPSRTGSCLAALIHYRTLFGEPAKRYASLDLPPETAAALTELAE